MAQSFEGYDRYALNAASHKNLLNLCIERLFYSLITTVNVVSHAIATFSQNLRFPYNENGDTVKYDSHELHMS